jgi:hypothetical protein
MLRPARPASAAAFGLALAAVLTLMVVAPSLLTAFTG